MSSDTENDQRRGGGASGCRSLPHLRDDTRPLGKLRTGRTLYPPSHQLTDHLREPGLTDRGRTIGRAVLSVPAFPAFLHPLSAFQKFPHCRAHGAALALLAVSACASFEQPRATALGDFQQVEPLGHVVLSSPLDLGTDLPTVRPVGPQSLILAETEQAALERPFRLTFAGAGADQLMRRIAENSNVEWVAEEADLLASSIVIDTTVRTTADLVFVVDVIAEAAGLQAIWSGRKVHFRSLEVGGVAGKGDSVLVRSPPISEGIVDVIETRFPISCGGDLAVTVCVGSPEAIQRASELVEVLNGRVGAVQWRMVETGRNLTEVVAALGLDGVIRAVEIVPGRWLVAALDGRAIETVSAVVDAALADVCGPVRFAPQYASADDASAALVASGASLCAAPAVIRGTVLASVHGDDKGLAVAEMLRADQPPPTARVMVYVVNSSGGRSAGLQLEDFALAYPGGFDLARATALAGIGRTEGVRVVEFTTDGKGEAAVTSTDRVSTDTLVTGEGAQFRSSETRSVGLTVGLDGRVSETGYVGRLSISDSVLDGDTTRGASCEAAFSLRLGAVSRVCSYRADLSARSAGFSGVDVERNAETFEVYAVLDAHQVAALETFSVGLR